MTTPFTFRWSLLLLSFHVYLTFDGRVAASDHEETGTNEKNIEIYKRLLRQKRIDQLDAVQKIGEIDTYDKQYSMVQILLQKMVSVLTDNVITLRESGFTPGDDFPTDETKREALSLVIENTAMFGDILLRMPDITHTLLRANKEWDLLLKSSVGFVNGTGILQEVDGKLLHLVAQELELVEKDPNYVNPFKDRYKKELEALEKSITEGSGDVKKKKPDVKKKVLKRGPRLSGKRTEL